MINKSKMAKANAVLAAVEAIIADNDEDDYAFSLEAYQNGRESGYALTSHDFKRHAVFSEYRNTDQIVLYTGRPHYFDMSGNAPNERAYGNKQFFSYNDYSGAAQFIVEYLKGNAS